MRKSLLKSIVATAVVGATMAITSVAAFAATNTYYYVEDSEGTVNTESFFAVTGGGAASSGLTSEFSFEDESTAYTPKSSIKMDGNGKVEFTTSGTASVELIYGLRTNKTSATVLSFDGTTFETTEVTKYVTQKFTDVDAGKHTIKRSGGQEGRIYGIKVVDVVSDSAKDYTISGTANLNNTTFTVGDFEVTSDASGNWSYTVKAETAPFAAGDQLEVKLAEYTASPAKVTLSAGTTETAFDAGNIEFTKLTLANIKAGTYKPADIEAGLPNFDKSALKVSSTGKYNDGSEFTFILEKAATVIVTGKSGSSTEGNDATFTIGQKTYEKKAGESFEALIFSCPAGRNTLTMTAGTTAQIQDITIAYGIADTLKASPKGGDYYCVDSTATYIIHPVSDAEMEFTSLAIANNETDKTPVAASKTTEVYESVEFSDGSSVTAEKCGATYIYAIKVEGTNGATPTNKYAWVDAE